MFPKGQSLRKHFVPGWRGWALCVVVLACAQSAGAVPPFEVPHVDRAPAVDAERGVVWAAALAAPDERLGRLSAMRTEARHSARARAVAHLHRWADDALAEALACPWDADAIHRAIDAQARVEGTRALPDGGAVVLVAVPVAALRDAAPLEGAPWSG